MINPFSPEGYFDNCSLLPEARFIQSKLSPEPF